MIPARSHAGLKRLAVSVSENRATEEDVEELSWVTAGKRATEAPLLSLVVRKELTPRGGGTKHWTQW